MNGKLSFPMKCCELTLTTPQENIACDEVLLDLYESGRHEGGLLRLWEPSQYFVVVGYANQVAVEVNRDFCQRHDIPILRRCSGGGTVLQGPGCLNYSLVLPVMAVPQLGGIAGTNAFILERHQGVFQALLRAPVERNGQTDLTIGGLKFSGNAQRRRKNFLLFHGSFLLHADLVLMEKALPLPSRQPEYRLKRSHADFLINIKTPAHLVKTALAKSWDAEGRFQEVPFDAVSSLVNGKYARDEWNLKF